MIVLLPKRTASHNKMLYLTIRKSEDYMRYSDTQKVGGKKEEMRCHGNTI